MNQLLSTETAFPDASERRETQVVLRAEHLRKRFGQTEAVADVSFDLHAGEVLGLLGPNGAGKTTLVRLVVGLLAPEEGAVELDGDVREVVAYLPQEEIALDEVPVRVALEQTARLRGLGRDGARSASATIVDELDLADVLDRPCGRLSGGQRRLAGIACAIVGDRPLLVLDEPTTGLDPLARRAVWEALGRRRDAGAAVLLVTHNVNEAETVLDRVAVVSHGRVLVCDTPGHVKGLAGDEVRLELVWSGEPPADPVVEGIARCSAIRGRRWSARMPAAEARAALAWLTAGSTLESLDDFTLSMPTLEDAYLALGGLQGEWDVA